MAVIWDITSLDSTKTVGSLSDVITAIHWTASDSATVDGVVHIGSINNCTLIDPPDSSSFVKYESVTKTNVVDWLKAKLGADKVTTIEKYIANQIKESKTPTRKYGLPSSW